MKSIIILFAITASIYSQIEIKDAWARISSANTNTAVFAKVVNTGDKPDTLYKAFSEFSNVTEIHETYKKGDMMGMREVEYIVVEPGKELELKPRSYHIMLIKLKNDIKADDKVLVDLFFKNSGKVSIEAIAKEMKMPEKMKQKIEKMKDKEKRKSDNI